jgi:hypothetical protein
MLCAKKNRCLLWQPSEKHINTLYGQNAEFLYVKAQGTYRYLWAPMG